jgi:hypothetical protein
MGLGNFSPKIRGSFYKDNPQILKPEMMTSNMKYQPSKKLVYIAVFLPLLVICVTLYIDVSRVSFVQIVNAANWKAFQDMLLHISFRQYILDLLVALIGAALFSVSCLSLGLLILRKSPETQSSSLAVGVTAFLIGEILFSVLFLTVISVYHLAPSFVAAILLIAFLAGLPALKQYFSNFHIHFRPTRDLLPWERPILVLVAIGISFAILLSFTRLGYDASAYYFSHAKIMAVSGLPIYYYPNDSFVVSSFHPGILFTAIIQLFGDQAARLLSWANGVAILIMSLAIGKELGFSPRTNLWFLVLMFSTTAFVDLLGDGKVELISTAPILAAVYWIVRGFERPSRDTSLLIGFFAGFAMISRPYNILLVGLFIAFCTVIYAFAQYRSGRFELKSILVNLFWIGVPILAFGLFNLLQNWIWLKNPFAPVIYARELDSTDWQWQFDPAELTLLRVLYPITLTFLNSPQSMGNISPLFICLLPLLLLKDVRQNLHIPKYLKWLLVAAILTLLAWILLFFTVVEIRYVFFLWIILFLAVAPILEIASKQLGASFGAVIVVFLSILCIRILMIGGITYLPVDGESQFHCSDNNLCNFMETVSRSAAPGDRILVLHAYRYYLRPDLFACSSQVDEYPVLENLAQQNSPEFWVQVYRQGYKFILFEKHLSESRYHFGKLPSPTIAPDWMDIKTLYSNQDGTQKIYKIETTIPPVRQEITCTQNSVGNWQITPKTAVDP